MLVALWVDVGMGVRSRMALEAAGGGGGGGAYSIVSVARLGSKSVWNSGMTIIATTRTDIMANDPIAAQGFCGRESII
jgi:hypothetical protein